MFGWFKKKPAPAPVEEQVTVQPPQTVFAWPKGTVITAVDEVVLALPMKLFDQDRPVAESIFGPDEMQITPSEDPGIFLIKLLPGMSVSLAKSCQTYVVAPDGAPRRIKMAKRQM